MERKVDALPDVQSLCELRQMAVARPNAVGVTQLDQVAVAALSAGDGDDAVGGRADRRAVRGRVIRALVRPPALENRMVPIAEPAGDVPVLERRTQKGAAQRPAPVVIKAGLAIRIIERECEAR